MLFFNEDTGADEGMPSRTWVAHDFVHWNMWQRRILPYQQLSEGTPVVLVDS